MKQPKPTPTRPDPDAKNEPAKRIETGGPDDVRQAREEGARSPGRARDAQARQDESDDDVTNANEEA
jgi:hypothetical protein